MPDVLPEGRASVAIPIEEGDMLEASNVCSESKPARSREQLKCAQRVTSFPVPKASQTRTLEG